MMQWEKTPGWERWTSERGDVVLMERDLPPRLEDALTARTVWTLKRAGTRWRDAEEFGDFGEAVAAAEMSSQRQADEKALPYENAK